MNADEFLIELVKLNWNINQNTANLSANDDVADMAAGRFINAPAELKAFVSLFVSCANADDNIWFLSVDDYSGRSDSAFAWNEFELQSLDVAEKNEIAGIEKFWNSHFPFMLSVKNGYAYIAVVLEGINKGSIVIGNEPMYEDVSIIASGMRDFFDLFIAFLKGENDLISLSILK